MNLEERFHEAMLGIYEEAATFDYRPTYFLRMVNEQGGLSAARSLLNGAELTEGLVRLWQEDRLDISVEALVLREPWNALFTAEELAKARHLLEEMGYYPESRGH